MKKIVKRVIAVVIVLLAVVTAAGLIAKTWIIPGIISSRVHAALADQWNGEVTVGSVDVNYSGPLLVHNINFRDRQDRPWLHIGSAELALRDWPGTSPVLTAIDANDMVVNMYMVDGRVDLPGGEVKTSSAASPAAGGKKAVDLERVTTRNISYSILDDQSREAKWTFGQLEVTRQPGGVYRVDLSNPRVAAGASAYSDPDFRLTGTIDQSHNADLLLNGSMLADSSRTAVMLRAMQVPGIKGVTGRIYSNQARLRGRLDDRGQWQLGGQITLAGFQFIGPYGELARNLNCAMGLSGRTIRITQFSATACNGSVTASGQADVAANWTVTYRGALNMVNVDMPMLTETVAGPGSKSHRGVLALNVTYAGTGSNIRGSAMLGLDDADVMPLPVFGEIFIQMGLADNEQLRRSHLRAALVFDGPQLTIEQGRMANEVSAIEVEKHGKINVRTRQVDLYVISVPLKAVESALKLPVIGIVTEPFRHFSDKLMRLHIMGDWSASPNTIVKKEPMTDISEGTVGFFQDVAKSGGKLGEGTLKGFNDLFRTLTGEK